MKIITWPTNFKNTKKGGPLFMPEVKKFYWIKLKTDFFSMPEIDFLLSQKNGAQYIVLYQMLCLMSANTSGELALRVKEMMIPFDIDKIARDTKHFNTDTIRVGLGLFKKLGLILEQDGNLFKIANYDEMISGETEWAKKKRQYRGTKQITMTPEDENEVERAIEIAKTPWVDDDK